MANILIIEDSRLVAMAEAYQLWNAGHEVDTAATGRDAIQKASVFNPEVIILDYDLPDMNGLAVLEELRNQNVDAPVIMVTSRADEGLAVKAMKRGVVDYVVKSKAQFEALGALVDNALEEVRVRRELTLREEELVRSEETARVLLNATRAAAMLIKRDGTVLSINEAANNLFNLSVGEKASTKISDFSPSGRDKDSRSLIETVFEQGKSMSYEHKHAGRLYESSILPVFDHDDNVARVAVYFHDITDQWQTEQNLKLTNVSLEKIAEQRTVELATANANLIEKVNELVRTEAARTRSENNLKRAQRIAHLGNWELDIKSKKIECSDETYKILGVDKDSFEGSITSYLKYFYKEDQSYLQDAIEKAIQDRSSFDLDLKIENHHGNSRDVEIQGEISLDSSGRPHQVIGTLLDITQRKSAERKLRESRELLQTVFDSYPHWLFITDKESKYLMVNRTFAEDNRLEPSAFIGKSAETLGIFTPEYYKVYREQDEELFNTEEEIHVPEVNIIDRSGQPKYYNMVKVPLCDDEGQITGIVGIAENITQRKKAEKESRLLTTAVDQAVESIIVSNYKGTIEYVNQAFEKITGYRRDEVMGKDTCFLGKEEDTPKLKEEIQLKLKSGENWQGRVTCQRKDNSEYEVDAIVSPIIDLEGQLNAFVTVSRDITKQLQMESSMQQSQKLEAIGTMVSGIAHEISNMLTPVMGYSEMLERSLAFGSDELDYAKKNIECLLRVRDLITQVLSVSRKNNDGVKPLSLNPMVKSIINLTKSTLPKVIEINAEITNEKLIVDVDATKFQSVLMNLCINAQHAMPKGGSLHVSLEKVEINKESANLNGAIGEYCAKLTVQDTGVGMDEATQKRIYEPFFTTKGAGKGTGLGLYTVFNIIEEFYGTIDLKSALNEGTKFQIYLPLSQTKEKSILSQGKGGTAFDPRGNESILLVDDEDSILKMGMAMLKGWGYRVTPCKNGKEALEAYKANPDAFDVVISDLMCPPILGDKLATHLKEIRPNVKFILCTGYGEDYTISDKDKNNIAKVLRKPWSRDDLGRAVKEIINADLSGEIAKGVVGNKTGIGEPMIENVGNNGKPLLA